MNIIQDIDKFILNDKQSFHEHEIGQKIFTLQSYI